MRLIDADELYDKLADRLTWLMGYGDEVYLTVGSTIRNVMDEQKTAYDVDKVVEQIKTLSPANYVTKDDVLKIVKGGGVNE